MYLRLIKKYMVNFMTKDELDAVLDAAEELKKRGREDIKLLFIGDGKLKPALK